MHDDAIRAYVRECNRLWDLVWAETSIGADSPEQRQAVTAGIWAAIRPALADWAREQAVAKAAAASSAAAEAAQLAAADAAFVRPEPQAAPGWGGPGDASRYAKQAELALARLRSLLGTRQLSRRAWGELRSMAGSRRIDDALTASLRAEAIAGILAIHDTDTGASGGR